VLFLVIALAGLVATTYFEFANRGRGITAVLWGGQQDGLIATRSAVNLRTGPRGDVVAVLPRGTRVRLLETSGGWARVKVLEWAGGPPENAPEEGWVDKSLIQFD
jgi:hypothetical protein